MNTLIIDISETCLRAVFSDNGVLEYCRTFDFAPISRSKSEMFTEESAKKQAAAVENPYLIYYDTEKKSPWELALKQITHHIRTDINTSIDSTHLIISSNEVIIETHKLPKMAKSDVLNLVGRKLRTETKEEFPPFNILPGTSDQKTQTWCSLYIPTAILKDYRKAFSACQMRLSSITTPINAMIDAFSTVRESIFNAHVIFEIQFGFIEAFYLSADGLLHFEKLGYAASNTARESNSEDADVVHKLKIFRIINTIFCINSNYLAAHPHIPVQKAWICGIERDLNHIVSALKEAMGIEVDTAPVMPTGLPDESGYVPLAGFAESLRNNTATAYSTADFLRRFPLRKTSGYMIYTLTAAAALIAISLTEMEYRRLLKQIKPPQQAAGSRSGANNISAGYTTQLEFLKKLNSRPFIFYNLFRELGNDLPDGVYLEGLEFHRKDNNGIINITVLSRLDDKAADNALYGKLMAMLDHSPCLKNHHEPTIAVIAKGKERFFQISISSEVNQLDSTK